MCVLNFFLVTAEDITDSVNICSSIFSYLLLRQNALLTELLLNSTKFIPSITKLLDMVSFLGLIKCVRYEFKSFLSSLFFVSFFCMFWDWAYFYNFIFYLIIIVILVASL